MRRFVLPLTFLTLVFFVSVAHAQRGGSDRVQRRLDDVRDMIEEEYKSIDKLERQLKDATDRDENARVDTLREELESAFDRLERLKELQTKLEDLLQPATRDGAEERDPPPRTTRGGSRKGKSRVPNPTFGGLDPEGAREGFGRDPEPAADRDRGARDRDRGRRDRGRDRDDGGRLADVRRLRHLRDALDSLNDAGEFGLARTVEQLIRQEENRGRAEDDADDRDRDRGRDRGRGDDREDDGPRRGTGRRGDADGQGRGGGRVRGGSGPIEVDGPPPRRGGQRQGTRDRDRDRDVNDELEDLDEELDRIREKGGG